MENSMAADASSQSHKKKEHEEEEGTISEASISEHLTSSGTSVENDRSFQEIEVVNEPLSLRTTVTRDQEPNISLNLSSLGSDIENVLPDKQLLNNSGRQNVKSILDEILGDAQFHSDNEESFNLFADLNLSDRSLILAPEDSGNHLFASLDIDETNKNHSDVDKRLRQLEEIVAVKDTTINALTQELDSFREMSNPTYTSSTMVSATEYKNLQDECHNKILEYNSAIIYKNDLIQQLSESLDHSVSERKELLAQVDNFKQQIADLQLKLEETSEMTINNKCLDTLGEIDPKVPDSCSINNNMELNDPQLVLRLQEEIVELKKKQKIDKDNYDNELTRLRDLLESVKCGSTELTELKEELEKKHAKDVEELRTYFEKKCAEVEKNYSEEVFSQQSRKLSGSSSDVELSAEFLLSSEPGPGGDYNKLFKTKEDIEKVKETLKNFADKLSKYSLENLNDKVLLSIETDVKNELNALLKIGEKLEIKAIENKYLEEISNLKFQLEEDMKRQGNTTVSSAIQEVGNSGDYELNEVVESYERRLQEQVTLAKIDIINALEVQVQKLAANESDDEEWPLELLQLREKFTRKYEVEIEELKEKHEEEIGKLKEDHLKILNGALERARRRSLRDENLTKADLEILKERDSLKKQVVSLRNLLSELVKYFTKAEDELNNTLVENLLKHNNDSIAELEEDVNLDVSSGGTNSSRILDSLTGKTWMHLTPNFGELISMIEDHSQQDDECLDISVDLKNELGLCLEKLKQEANAILALTVQPRTSKPSSPQTDVEEKLSKQLMLETQHKDRLKEELVDSNMIIESLEKEKELCEARIDELVQRINLMETDLEGAKYKIAELLENREIVSEGYGEAGNPVRLLEDTTKVLSDVQERARNMLAKSRTSVDPKALQLIEELCRVSEEIKEEAKKECRDLCQQIEVADKKYRTTQKFLEEQAAEREQERDEAQKKIEALHGQLRARDKDRANCQIMSNEAEELEQQIQELTSGLANYSQKYKELESERDEAVSKIQILRDVVRDLEERQDEKEREIEEHLRNVQKLECIVYEQRQSLDELITPHVNVSDIQNLRRHCDELEEEVQKLRIGAELAGSEGALRQIKLQLFEIETDLDKKTKELEQLHSAGTNSCSSPSEDMSVRDLVRPQTSQMDDCEVPLQQLARLKEKLLRHSRAEQAAMKRIHDLEMQAIGLKTELEETNNEKEFMKRQIHEQLVLISDFQIRLDQQRIKAEHIEKQTNTSLESKIYDLQNEIENLQEKLRSKDKSITLQEQIIADLKQRIRDMETELETPKEDELVVQMQKQLENLRQENRNLKEKAATEQQILPNIVENIIQDKNSDIEKLRNKLLEMEELLQSYTSLNLDGNDLKTLANLKNSGGSIEQLISILDLSQPIDQMRRYDQSRTAELSGAAQLSLKKGFDTESNPEISSIEKIGGNFNFTATTPIGKPNSTEIGQKRVHFEDTSYMATQIESLKAEIENKNQTIQEMQTKLEILHQFEANITKLQNRLDETERALISARETFEKEQENAVNKEKLLGVELAEKKMHLSEFEKEVTALKDDSKRKDEMYLQLAKEKRDLEHELQLKSSTDQLLNERESVINRLEKQQIELIKTIETAKKELHDLRLEMNTLSSKADKLDSDKIALQQQLKIKENENDKLTKEITNKNSLVEQISLEIGDLKGSIHSKETELDNLRQTLLERETVIKQLQQNITKKDALIIDKDCDIEILNEDLKFYQNQAIELENKMKSSSENSVLQESKLRISELTKEIAHLQEALRKKEAIIERMTEDEKKVHANLQTIDSKIKETGNILDLSNRLKNEQKKNADLFMEIHRLKASLLNYEAANSAPLEDITGQVKKELEQAAQIDSNILSAVSDQSLNSISEGQDVEVYMKSLRSQKSQNKQLLRIIDKLEKDKLSLEQTCSNFHQRLKEMQIVLEKEKIVTKQTMIEDTKLIEQLRIKLDSALDYQETLQKLLEDEKRCRRMLEIQCEELRKPSSSSESTKYKSLPTQADLEVARLKKELEEIKEDKNKLVKKIKLLQMDRNELKNNLKYTEEMLALETDRNKAQEERITFLNDKEKSLSEELLRKKFELEIKDRDLEEKKIKMDELEQEKSVLKKQKTDLAKALKVKTSTINLEDTPVPETLENLIKELKAKSDENKRRLHYIEQIEREKKMLEEQLRNEVRNGIYGNMPFGDLVERCNFLFAKSLKLESVKKALIWQKRYLTDFLQSHQKHCLIEVLPRQPHENHCLRRRHSPLQHFRSAVYVLISIERMKYLVKRWQSGIRKCDKINAPHYQRSCEKYLQENAETGAHFQVGQPVSNNPFRATSSSNNNRQTNPFRLNTNNESRPESPVFSVSSIIRDLPWSGNTPPSREIGRNHEIRSWSNNNPIRDSLAPLEAPQLLTHLHERVEQIQDRLKLSFPANS